MNVQYVGILIIVVGVLMICTSLVSAEEDQGVSFLRGVSFRPDTGYANMMEVFAKQGYKFVTTSVVDSGLNALYDSKYLTHHELMDSQAIPDRIKSAHEQGIKFIAWFPLNRLNVRDLQELTETQYHRFPQWRAKYIEDPNYVPRSKGMSLHSPYLDWLTEVVIEIVELGVDGIWFDRPHYDGSIEGAGSIDKWSAELFKEETGHTTPDKIDWSEDVFKIWVLWRYQKMDEIRQYLTGVLKKANPDLIVMFNTCTVPFPGRGWQEGNAMWRRDSYGVSQHAYDHSNQDDFDVERIMLTFKARLSRSMNPKKNDIWRPTPSSSLQGMTFVLGGLTYGTRPWYWQMPIDSTVIKMRNDEIEKREQYFPLEDTELNYAAMVVSQNTLDFYGHHPGIRNIDGGYKAQYMAGLTGFHELFSDGRMLYQMMFDNELQTDEIFKYDVLILSNTAALSKAASDNIRKFVKEGGLLVSTFESSLYDQWGNIRDNFELADVFGADWDGHGDRWRFRKSLEMELKGKEISFVGTMNDIMPTNGTEIFANIDGSPAVIRNEYGKGVSLYFAFDPGASYGQEQEDYNDMLRGEVINWIYDVKPTPIEVDGPFGIYVTAFYNEDESQLMVNLLNLRYTYEKRWTVQERSNWRDVEGIVIKVHGLEITRASAVVLDEELEIVKSQDCIEVLLPSMIKQDEIVILDLQ